MNTLGYIIVFVSDMEKSAAFYRDVLGFPVKHPSHKWTELVQAKS
jgi:catechol 2,3-dioxygenase-like lactoylglutathione lyase family enzyme